MSTGPNSELSYWLSQLPPTYNQAAALRMATILDTSSLYYFGSPTNPPSGSPFTDAGVNGFVNQSYLKYLGRNAAQSEIDSWISVFTPASSTRRRSSALLDSPEYFVRRSIVTRRVPVSGVIPAETRTAPVLSKDRGRVR